MIADEHVLLGASFGAFSTILTSLSSEDAAREIKLVKRIPMISELCSDYFEGDIEALNSILVRHRVFQQLLLKVLERLSIRMGLEN